MKYYIGIDGGGTNTVGVIGDENTILDQRVVGPTNYHNIGLEAMKETLESLLSQLCASQGIMLSDVNRICFGGAGIDTVADEKRIRQSFQEIPYTGNLDVMNDALVAMAAENGSLSGGILISGTGSVCYGVKKDGMMIRVGGWGHILDDEGSAYAIARDAIKAILESYDGRGPKTELFKTISAQLGLTEETELVDFVYGQSKGKHEIAQLAPLVSDLYEQDTQAKRIIDHAVHTLKRTVMTLYEKMDFEPFALVVSGSVLVKNERIFSALRRALPAEILMKRLEHEAAVGAYHIAKGNL